MLKDPSSTASSGILLKTLLDAQSRAAPGDPLKQVKAPKDLTLEQRVQVYEDYMNKALEKVGGAAALEQIPDKQVVRAVVDTLIRHGPQAGTFIIQKAVNELRWQAGLMGISPTGVFGEKTLSALITFLRHPASKNWLMRWSAKGGQRRKLLSAPGLNRCGLASRVHLGIVKSAHSITLKQPPIRLKKKLVGVSGNSSHISLKQRLMYTSRRMSPFFQS